MSWRAETGLELPGEPRRRAPATPRRRAAVIAVALCLSASAAPVLVNAQQLGAEARPSGANRTDPSDQSVASEAKPPSAASGAVAFSDRAAAEAVFFLLEQHFGSDNGPVALRARYADQVSYYGRGLYERAKVLDDKRAYIARWPVREVAPDLTTLEVEADGDGAHSLSIEYNFTVSNTRTTIRGRSLLLLTLARREGRIVITRESGRILSRR